MGILANVCVSHWQGEGSALPNLLFIVASQRSCLKPLLRLLMFLPPGPTQRQIRYPLPAARCQLRGGHGGDGSLSSGFHVFLILIQHIRSLRHSKTTGNPVTHSFNRRLLMPLSRSSRVVLMYSEYPQAGNCTASRGHRTPEI